MIESRLTEVFETVKNALCRSRGDAEVRRIIDAWGPFKVDDDDDDRVYYVAKKTGVSLLFTRDVLDTVFFYSGRTEGFRAFKEEILRQVGAGTTRSEVLAAFGEPASAGSAPLILNPSQRVAWVKYRVGDVTIHFSFSPDETERLDMLTVARLCE